MYSIGVQGNALKLIESYLQNRHQVVKIGNYESSSKTITYGVPQGSILGPLLFLIYINNICKLGLKGEISLYADDTCLFYYGTEMKSIISDAQDDLDTLNLWFQDNLLTINVAKTNYMIFSAKNKVITDHQPPVINNIPLNRVKTEKYLGLTLDSRLTWKPHIDKITSKISSLMGALRGKVRNFPKSVRYTIYNSLVKSHLNYLIEVWGCAAKTNLQILQTTQNKLIKMLFHYDYLTSTSKIYKETNIMTLSQLYKFNTCIFIRKIMNHKVHTQITFTKKSQLSKRSLRRANDLVLRTPRTNYGKKNILYEGAQIFNKLPRDIKDTKSFISFKHILKSHFSQDFSEFKK